MDTKSFLNEFNKIITKCFDAFLLSKGFKFQSCANEQLVYMRVYRRNNQYIMISANVNPMNYPYFWNILLGEGTTEMPEGDWNKIALWQLMRPLENPSATEFLVDLEIDKLADAVKTAKDDLEKYAESFLEGDLKLFYQVRSLVNRKREPYKIYSKDEDGNLVAKDDEISKKLKEKFS